MSYYMVDYKDKHYCNRALAKRMFRVGDAGLMFLMTAKSSVQSVTLLDQVAFAVTGDIERLTTGIVYQHQDLDAQLRAVRESKLPRLPSVVCTQDLERISFLLLEHMNCADRYREIHKHPWIQVFSKKYVAVVPPSSSKLS